VTINDFRSNASILQKSMEAYSSKQDNDAKAGSSKKAKGKKGKDPMEDLDAEGPESSDDTHGSLAVHLLNDDGSSSFSFCSGALGFGFLSSSE